MANISEKPIPEKTMASINGSWREGLAVLGLKEQAEPEQVIKAIDQFVFNTQQGKRPNLGKFPAEDLPFALGTLWGQQLVREFGWQWGMITFHDHGNSTAPGVLSPDRSLAIYPIHFLIGALRDAGVDATVELSFNMLAAGNIQCQPREYANVMEGVRRIVPRR